MLTLVQTQRVSSGSEASWLVCSASNSQGQKRKEASQGGTRLSISTDHGFCSFSFRGRCQPAPNKANTAFFHILLVLSTTLNRREVEGLRKQKGEKKQETGDEKREGMRTEA